MKDTDSCAGYLINDIVEFLPKQKLLVRKDNSLSITLHAPASGCLLSLIEHHPDIVSQKNLIIGGWGELHGHVSPNTFYQTILGLRQCLEDAGLNKDVIVTVRRRGLLIPATTIIVPIEITGSESLYNTNSDEFNLEEKSFSTYDVKNEISFQNKLTSPQYRYGRLAFITIFLLVISFIAIIFNKKMSSSNKDNNDYFSSYHKLEMFNDCHIFSKNPMLKHDSIMNFIKENNLGCDKRNWWYISADLNSKRISVVRCFNDVVNSSNNYCSTDYYYENKNDD